MAYIDDVNTILQIQPNGMPTFVRLSQNENGRNLYFSIVGNEADIPAGVTVTISGTKPDGNVYSATGTISNNVVLIKETVQLTAVAGTWDAKIKLISGGNTIATGRVRFIVDAETVAPGAVPSDSELEGLVAEAGAYAEAAKDAAYYGSPLVASTVSGMTDKTRVYVYTGSESGYTSGNWYYWNGSAWTSGGVYNSQGIQTDTTLKVAGMAADAKAVGDALDAVQVETDKTLTQADVPADAKAVGDELSAVKEDLDNIRPGFSDDAVKALLACFRNVAWTTDEGQELYSDLADEITIIISIDAVFDPGTTIFYTDNVLDDLREYLTVTAYTNIGDSYVTTNYTLSGTLAVGVDAITVTCSGKTTTFTVTVRDATEEHLVYELPANTNISNQAIDTGISVFGPNEDYTILIKAHMNAIPSDNNTKYLLNHGYLNTGTLRLGVIYNPNYNTLTVIDNVMYQDHVPINVTGNEYECDIMYVIRMQNKHVTKRLYIDNTRHINKNNEDVSSYMNDKVFTGNYMISCFANTSETNGFFPGVANLFRIYDMALTDDEIESIMDIEM